MLTGAEPQQLLVTWNATQTPYPDDCCIHQLFEAQVDKTPDAIAVVFEDQQLSYTELNTRANQLAHHLQTLGVMPEVMIGLCMERSPKMLIGLLAILKAGGVYVPLDPAYPKERLAFMLADTSAPVLITQSNLKEMLPEHAAQCVFIDQPQLFDRYPVTNLNTSAAPDNLAYVIYTSGSTGQPKGVMIPHKALAGHCIDIKAHYELKSDDHVLQFASLNFDASLEQILTTLVSGARLILRGNEVLSPQQFYHSIAVAKVSVMNLPPSYWHQLGLAWADTPLATESLRLVIIGGEAMSPGALKLWQQTRFDGVRLLNAYGPTETTITAMTFEVPRHYADDSCIQHVPIGRPRGGRKIYILDGRQQPVPIGVAGELYISGPGLARGYLNCPELTAEKFIATPSGEEPGVRLYKTGDLARYLPDGNIEFLGRIDHQVKIRGFRIELGEIEATLNHHPGVRESVVLAREDTPGDKRLVAYWVASESPAPGINELRNYLTEQLPEYMVPAAFFILEAMPLMPNGKLDRKALPAPVDRRHVLEQAYVTARDELEHFLAGIWCELLRLDQIGIYDNFFQLGGDSIQAAIFLNRIQRELGEFMYIVAIFNAPSITEFAAFLRKDYAQAVARRFPSDLPAGVVLFRVASEQMNGVDSSTIAQMRQYIVLREPHIDDGKVSAAKNLPAIFILAPPRSGTTLLRIMLAGHPDLFAAAELQLLGFHTLMERKTAYSGKFSLWLEGAYRAIMEIKACDAEQAKCVMEDYERRGYSTKEFFGVLQEWVKPRILADKSTSYALDPEALKSAEREFENPLYIHLVRDPRAMVNSFVNYRMDQVLFLREHPFSLPLLGELVWTLSHQTILGFLKDIPMNRQHRINFEDLVTNPQETMEKMCLSLGLEFHPDLMQPYKNKEKKMIDGIYPESTPMGDTRFREHQDINPKVVEKGRKFATEIFLGDITQELAESFGYEMSAASPIECTNTEQITGMLDELSDAEIDTLLTDLENRTG